MALRMTLREWLQVKAFQAVFRKATGTPEERLVKAVCATSDERCGNTVDMEESRTAARLQGYRDMRQDHLGHGDPVPGSRFFRAYCDRCGMPMRVGRDDLYDASGKPQRHWCESCGERSVACGNN